MDKIELINKREKIKNYILYFFIYAISGWILETIYAIICGNLEKRGFLYGPLCPIYGFGAIAIILLMEKSKISNIRKFMILTITLTIAEYIVSYIAEVLFGIRLWDYAVEPYNVAGRICLVFSIVWGIGGVVFINYIHPFLDQYIFKTTNKIKNVFLFLGTFIFAIDLIISIIRYIK